MKIKVNSDIIKSLTPCEDRLVNYLNHYNKLNFDILEFLALDKITTEDKVWVSVRLMPKELVAAFAVDCASRASTYAAQVVLKSSTYAAHAVSHASYAASYAAKAASLASYADRAASYADLAAYDAAYAADLAAYDAAYAQGASDTLTAATADTASAEERELQLKSIAQLIETLDGHA